MFDIKFIYYCIIGTVEQCMAVYHEGHNREA